MLLSARSDLLPILGASGVAYSLRDKFTTNRSAGAVNGTAPDGVGPNRVAGAANVAITGGELVHTGTGTWTDASFYYASGITRTPGRILRSRVKFSSASQLSMFGFRTDQSTSQIGYNNTGLYLNTGALLARRTSDGTSPTARTLAAATYYDFYTVLRAAGKFVFTNLGSYPILDIVDDWSSAATLYIGANTLTSAQTLSHDEISISYPTWLPSPLVSDGFGSAFGTTDGLGHAEGVAGGLGTGGSGVSWSQRVGTWANSAGSAAASALSGGIAIATVPVSTAHSRATAKTTRSGGTVGVVVRYVDANNYIYSVHNGTGVNLRKVVAGVDSQVMAVTTATYAAGAEHTIVPNGTKFRVLYNQMNVGAEQTITDPALQTGTNVGLYTTDTGNTVSDFRAYALGVEGQYAVLNTLFSNGNAGGNWLSSAQALALTPTKSMYLYRVSASFYHVYKHLGGNYWLDSRLDDQGLTTTPFSWTRARIREAIAIVLSKAAACTYSGTWTAKTYSGDPEVYVGGVMDSSTTVGADVDVAFTMPVAGDVYAVVVKHSGGGYIACTLDGSVSACNELAVHSGQRIIDTYSASTLNKQVVKVASGVAAGAHTLSMTLISDKNASSSGNSFRLNAVAYTVADPSQATWRAPAFQSSVYYEQYDQIEVENRSYYCSTAGNSTTTAPTHTSGTVSNGTAAFTYMAKSSYGIRSHLLHSASQVEYAYEVKPSGASATQDVGGQNHGNETRDSATWYIDGNTVTLSNGEFRSATEIRLEQALHATHTEVVGDVTDTTLKHTWTKDKLTIWHQHTWKKASSVGYYLTGMWPALAWSAESNQLWVDKMALPSYGTIDLSTRHGLTGYVGQKADYIHAAWGDINLTQGVSNQPAADTATHTALTLVTTTPTSMNYYVNSAKYAHILAMQNVDDIPGSVDVRAKEYFEVVPTVQRVETAVNDVWTCEAEYYQYLIASPTITFPPAA